MEAAAVRSKLEKLVQRLAALPSEGTGNET